MIEARIDSAGVDLERLLPPPDPNAPKTAADLAALAAAVHRAHRGARGLRPVQGHRIEPFDGILSLEPRRARLEVKEARVCGMSFPMEVEAQPEESAPPRAHHHAWTSRSSARCTA